MKVYVSAPRSMAVEAETIARVIEDGVPGAVVSPRWWETIAPIDDSGVSDIDARIIAQEQAIAVLSADVVVYLGSRRGDGQGTHTELGLALAGQHLRGSPVVLGVGDHCAASIFNRLTTRWLATWADVIAELQRMERL